MSCTADCDWDKWQTHPLVRKGAPRWQNWNCMTVTNIWSWAPDGAGHQDLLANWSLVVMWLWLWDSKIWSWVPWDSEPRIAVLLMASSNLAVSRLDSCGPEVKNVRTFGTIGLLWGIRQPLMTWTEQDIVESHYKATSSEDELRRLIACYSELYSVCVCVT
jgi:hypothetical protein